MYEDIFLDSVKGKVQADRPFQGVIHKGVKEQQELLFIRIPDLDNDIKRGPCYWTPRPSVGGPALPAGGEKCLAIMDHKGRWWVLQWWPYTG